MSDIAATCLGVKVPSSPFLNPGRIERINKARYEGQEIAGALALIVGAVVAHNRKPARIISFEANPNLLPHIRELYGLNGLEHVIEVRNELLVTGENHQDSYDFHIHKSYLGSSMVANAQKTTETVQIPTRNFSDVVAELDPNVLIMDVEGAELDFLEHADLSAFKGIVLEFHPGAYGDEGVKRCKTLLRNAGFAPDQEVSTRFVWAARRVT